MCMIVWFISCVPYLQNVYDCMVYFLCSLISKCVCLYGLFSVCLIIKMCMIVRFIFCMPFFHMCMIVWFFSVCLIIKMCMIVWFILCMPYFQNVYDCMVYFLCALFAKYV